MTQVEFHILENQSGEASFLRLIGQCVQSLYRQGRKVYVHTANQELAHKIDEWLWTQDLKDFIPHNLVGEGPSKPPPIQIGFAEPPQDQHDCLINVSGQVQDFFSYFLKCYEIVPNIEADKEAARERYKFYRGRGYPLQHKKH